MRTLRGALLAVGAAMGAAALAGFAAAGCGDDTSATAGDSGGGDVVADNTTDSPEEATGMDGGTESSNNDSGDGQTMDVVVTPDASDAADAPVDAYDAAAVAAAELAFANSLVQAVCNSLAGCCQGGADSGAYAQCLNSRSGYGWEGNLPHDYLLFPYGFVNFDSTKAANCLAAVQALPCGTQTPAQWAAVTQACELVLTGRIGQGQPGCHDSFECTTNTYCNAGNDGGTGTCVPLASQGQPCNTVIQSPNAPIPDYMCSYLGSSNTGLFCDLIDPVDSGAYGTCQPLFMTSGANCFSVSDPTYFDDQACAAASGGAICGDLGCGTSTSYPYPFTCTIQDAGGGG